MGVYNHHIVDFFETSVLEEVRILCYLHNNSAVLILMLMLSSRIKWSYAIPTHTWKTFEADFFYDNLFYTLFFLLFHTFLYKWAFFEKLKTSLKACFYIIL